MSSTFANIDPRLGGNPSSSSSSLAQQPGNSQSNNRQAVTSIAPHPAPSTPIAPSQYQPIYNGSNTPLQHQLNHHQTQHQNQQQQQQQQQLQHSFLPHTPQSTADPYRDGTPDGGRQDSKRPRACEACRGLKVKCEPDPNNEDGPCKRCAKSNRSCLVTQPSRKRQKKTDSRVAELEKKIEDLQALASGVFGRAGGEVSASLGAPQHSQNIPKSQTRSPVPYLHAPGGPGNTANHLVEPYKPNDWGAFPKTAEVGGKPRVPPMVVAGLKRKQAESPDSSTPGTVPSYKGANARALYDDFHSSWANNAEGKPSQTHIYSDVIDRGQLTAEMAEEIFDCYVNRMAHHLPAVVFPPGTSASSVRKEKPILFLAILAVGAGPVYPSLQHSLTKEIMTVYADRIIIKGEKSLEIIQALQISTLWYYPPEHFEELKFYQLVHIAAIMAIDIGMGKPNKASSSMKSAGLFRDTPWRKQPYPDSDSMEARRAWLACYFLSCNTAMGLRRPNLIRWTSYMEDCVITLETSPEAYDSDKALCAWIRSQHIAEEVGYEFSMDDSSAKISISDDKVNYALRKFEQDLEKWRAEVPVEARSDSLEMTGHVISLYMHEIAMHVDHNVEEFKPPYNEETIQGLVNPQRPEVLTMTHVRALSACLTAIDGVFEVFLKHSVDVVRCLPVANFVRVAYATVVLIKMSLAASHSENGIGKIFVQSALKVEEHLDGLIDLFGRATADNKSRPSSKFLMVLVMLKTWFNRRQQGFKNAADNPPNGSVPVPTLSVTEQDGDGQAGNIQRTDGQQKKQSFAPSNTPLQVLSDVATGNAREPHGHPEPYAVSSNNDWQQNSMQQQQFQPYSLDSMSQPNYTGAVNFDNNFGMTNLDYTMGAGFETAMGFTMAGLDAYLGDDALFTGVMSGGYNFDA